jgi:hypothetical protein
VHLANPFKHVTTLFSNVTIFLTMKLGIKSASKFSFKKASITKFCTSQIYVKVFSLQFTQGKGQLLLLLFFSSWANLESGY